MTPDAELMRSLEIIEQRQEELDDLKEAVIELDAGFCRLGNLLVDSVKSARGRLLVDLVRKHSIKRVLELGTGFGLGSMYLWAAAQSVRHDCAFLGVEKESTLCDYTQNSLAMLSRSYIEEPEIVNASAPDVLMDLLDRFDPQLVFVSGLKEQEEAMNCLLSTYWAMGQGVILLDGFRVNSGILKGWNQMRCLPRVVDAFVFPGKPLGGIVLGDRHEGPDGRGRQ